MTPQTAEERLERLLAFSQCPFCTFDFATGEGERACHYGDCPGLPEELDPRCPTCSYNAFADDIEPACGNPPTCEWARVEAPQRLEVLALWMEQHED